MANYFSADWSIVWVTGVLTIVTGLLAIFTYKLWADTARSSKQAARAFVFIDGFNYELTTMADSPHSEMPEAWADKERRYCVTRFAIQPRWKNSGATPTKNMKIRINNQGPIGNLPPDFIFNQSAAPFFVAPNSIEQSHFIEIQGLQAPIDYGLNPIAHEPILLIWGRADYEDIFGDSHFVEWCYRIRVESHKGGDLGVSFIQWGEYNRSDE